MLITIFTPTYNRAELLPKLYSSLTKQTFMDFEWIIVDDGSTDNTKEVIDQFRAKNNLSLKYIYQQNKGKHIAINTGVQNANGVLFFIVDSDDVLPEDSLKTIINQYHLHNYKEDFCGVVGRRTYMNGEIIGTISNIETKYETTLNLRYKYKIWGDFAEVYLTTVLKEFPFPSVENERFVPEAIVWNLIAKKYKVIFINQGIYSGEYLADGLTSKMVKIRMQSPRLSMKYYAVLASCKIPFKEKLKCYINFWRFAFNSNTSILKLLKIIGFFASIIGIPFGFFMFLKDKKQYR